MLRTSSRCVRRLALDELVHFHKPVRGIGSVCHLVLELVAFLRRNVATEN